MTTMTERIDRTREALRDMYPSLDFDRDMIQHRPEWGYFTLSTGKYLLERLEYLPDHDAAFHAWVEERDGHPFANLNDAVTWATDFLGVPEHEVQTVNTYNGECVLDDTLQWTTFAHPWSGDQVVMLQVHRGGDVRGNYSDVRVFVTDEECFGHDVANAEAWCTWTLTPPQEEELPGLPAHEPEYHGFSLSMGYGSEFTGPDGEYYDGPEVRTLTDEDGEEREVYACPMCLERGRVSALEFGLPTPY